MATKLQEIQACPQICDYELYLNYVYEENHKATGYRATATFKSLSIFFGLLDGNLGLGYKATLNSNMYANMRLWALLDYVKEVCLLHYVDKLNYKTTSKLKEHIFDMGVMNAICIFNKHM